MASPTMLPVRLGRFLGIRSGALSYILRVNSHVGLITDLQYGLVFTNLDAHKTYQIPCPSDLLVLHAWSFSGWR